MPTTTKLSSIWNEIGSAISTPLADKTRVRVNIDSYYVVIGFEVNVRTAYLDDTQDLDKDYGHAFFYLVKNGQITVILSFGPDGLGNSTFIKSGDANSRVATADYPIDGKVSAFKISLNEKKAKKLHDAVMQVRMDIASRKILYSAYLNDTCAETARDTLEEAEIDTPNGSGWVRYSGNRIAYAVNPYKWHANFKAEVGGEKFFIPEPRGIGWLPVRGERDTIFAD